MPLDLLWRADAGGVGLQIREKEGRKEGCGWVVGVQDGGAGGEGAK